MIPDSGPSDRSWSRTASMAAGDVQSMGESGPPIRSAATPSARSLSSRSRASPRPSSVITTRPVGISPARSRGTVASTTLNTRLKVPRLCFPLLLVAANDGSPAGFCGTSGAAINCSAALAIRSTMAPSVRARAIASIISGESASAFNCGNSSRSLPRISTRLIESIPRSASISKSSPKVSIG